MLSKKTIIDKIWGEENELSHKTRTLNDVGYKAAKGIKGLFPSKEFLEKDKYHYFTDRNYKITTELDAISYEIRDIEGIGDDELRLKKIFGTVRQAFCYGSSKAEAYRNRTHCAWV